MTAIELYNKNDVLFTYTLTLRKSTGDKINGMLPEFLMKCGFRVLALTEQTLILVLGKNDVIDQQIFIEHGFGKDDGIFRMSVKNPAFFSKIDMLTDTDASVYYKAMSEILNEKTFIEKLKETLIEYDKEMIPLRNELKEIEEEIKKLQEKN